MSTAGIIFSVVAAILGVLWILSPLFMRAQESTGDNLVLQKQRELLLVHYEQVLRTIRDLDEDFQMDKLAKNAYEEVREQQVQRGIQVLQALDEMPQIEVPHVEQLSLSSEELDAHIEAEIARYLTAKAGST